MSIKDDSYEMLDLRPEKSKQPRLLLIGLVILLALGASAYAWQHAHRVHPVVPVVETINQSSPPASTPASPPVPTKKIPTPVNLVINFATDSAEITPVQMAKLQSLADLIKDTPGTMQISAYTDNEGSEERDNALAQQRAAAVVQALKGLGVDGNIQYKLVSYGELYPIADNATEAGRALNRRAEIYFSPAQ